MCNFALEINKEERIISMANRSQMSPKVSEILAFSKEEAQRLASNSVTPEHIMLGILREKNSPVKDFLIVMEIDLNDIKNALEEKINNKYLFLINKNKNNNNKTFYLHQKITNSNNNKFLESYQSFSEGFSLTFNIRNWNNVYPKRINWNFFFHYLRILVENFYNFIIE